MIISNLYQDGNKVPWGRDYLLFNKTAMDEYGHTIPVRIAVIGLAGNYGSSILAEKFSDAGYSIHLDYGEVNALAEELESSGACDATILQVHESASTVAPALGSDSVIDLVLGGHTHYNVCEKTGWGLRYVEPSCNSKAYARVELAFSMGTDGPVFENADNARVVTIPPLANNEIGAPLLDQQIVALTDHVVDLISGILNTRIGIISESVLRYTYLPGSGSRSTSCGNWMSSILARIYGADVGFVNSGGMRLDFPIDSRKGYREITRSDLYEMFPFDNKVYLFSLTWEELLQALQYSLTAGGSGLLSDVTGVTCYYEGNWVTALLNAEGQVVYADGAWRDGWPGRALTVSVSEYVANTDRPNSGLSNPFVTWADTPRLLASDKIDNVSAIEVLEAEAEAHGGCLAVSTVPHYIQGILPAPIPREDAMILPARIRVIESEAFAEISASAVIIPPGCVSVQAGAFKNCKQLREIWLPAGCEADPSAFEGYGALVIPYGTAE